MKPGYSVSSDQQTNERGAGFKDTAFVDIIFLQINGLNLVANGCRKKALKL